MAYQIFLTDDITSVQLDTENIEAKTIFSLVELQDVGNKRNNIETLKFKGTDANNEAFGFFFDFGRTTDLDNPNKLFFNYNPIRAVKVLVFEESVLIFVGDLRLSQIDINSNNEISYDCIVTTNLILLKTALAEKYLTDLDFSDLRHRYYAQNIINSWDTSIEIANGTGFTTTSFAFGKGYTYPLVDYGYRFSGTSSTWSGNTIPASKILNIKNMRPALYLREYFNKIFSQDVLNGFTYEIRGSQNFVDMFNHIVIPDSNEPLAEAITGIKTTGSFPPASMPFSQSLQVSQFDIFIDDGYRAKFSLTSVVQPPPPINNYIVAALNQELKVTRDITTSIAIDISGSVTTFVDSVINPDDIIECRFRLVKVDRSVSPIGQTELITTSTPLPYTATTNVVLFERIDNVELKKDDCIALFIEFYSLDINYTPPTSRTVLSYTWNKLDVLIPATTEDILQIAPIPSLSASTADFITPKVTTNIKQLDFLKSVINLFNFVVYTENTNYKHLIFELYDDFYALSSLKFLKDNSLDWSKKIDYTNGISIKPNIELPKSYLFTFKSDDDFLNKTYRIKYNENYGEFSFDDELGLLEKKTVELIFSPTPITTIDGYNYPLLYQVNNGQIQKNKINPRLFYYNGYFAYDIFEPNLYLGYEPEGSSTITIFGEFDKYPQASNYYLIQDSGSTQGYTVDNDIHFNSPKEYYFDNVNNLYTNINNSYTNYYINQITELTSEEVIYVDCSVLLNEIDISNLDLSVPVWIDTGKNNGAFFKVISVEYENKDLPSRVRLQKILT